ncbi:hypothetical protein [Marinisporobacter balticus]|uniref:Uncharacterized protein n=1 Tax=Marinisporobacter balticus TaxID=2018667 RepID=A0A4R2L540_9FIRM|nr:hypothetical protein [Marinisporobacter balticus]TCO79109.1 hypothetical protein EV214_103161 [Marinisporobacter balticus]
MKDRYAMEVSSGVVELAQKGMDWKKLFAEAQEICELNRQAIKKEIAIQRFVENVKGDQN